MKGNIYLCRKIDVMNGNDSLLNYINGMLIKFIHAVRDPRNEELDDLCLTLNLLYRAKYNIPFLLTDKGEFLSDNLESVEDPIVIPLNEAYKSPSVLELICNTFKELYAIEHEKFLEVYPDVVEDTIKRVLTIRKNDIPLQPEELSEFIYELLAKKGCRSVYNPFAGIASYGVYLKDEDYYCQDKHPLYRMIGRIRMDAYHKDASKYCLGDCVSEWDDHEADCIVSTLPYGNIVDPNSRRKAFFEFFIDAFMHSNAQYAFIVTVPNVCFNYQTRELREWVTKRGLLEMVVSLPAGLFINTALAHNLIVLNKKNEANKVLFADASDLAVKDKRRTILNVADTLSLLRSYEAENRVEVNIDTISERDCQWNPKLYISLSDNQNPYGLVFIRFFDIFQLIRNRNTITEKSGYVIHKVDLYGDDMIYVKEPGDFAWSDNLKYTYRIDEPVLLLSYFGQLKPIYVQASPEKPIYVNNGIYAFKLLTESVDLSYLCWELSKINPFYGLASSSQRLDLYHIEGIRIPLCSLDEQRRLYKEALEAFKLSKAKELGLMDVIEKMKKDYMNTVRERKHNMKTPLTEIRNTLYFLNKFADKVPGESAERYNTLIKRVEKSLDKLSSYVSHLADEQVFSDPEPVNLEEILSKEVREEANYVVKYQRDDAAFDLAEIESPIVMMGKTDAMSMVQNIVDNAINHGFDDLSEKYTLTINLTIEDDYYIIEFVNNGKPLPEGINKDRYGIEGMKSGDSKGSGIGGYVVKSITEHYGGDYDIFSRDSSGEMLTYVIVKLPICLGNE